MTKSLKITRFGNPILRKTAKCLVADDIKSDDVKQLIKGIRKLLESEEYRVGLAAPQVGYDLALSVIGIKPTPTRPDLEPFESVIINPEYEGIGKRTGKWEGCISCGRGDDTLYANVLRFSKINAKWYDENGVRHEEILEGFVAHVFQHETDHLNGILFVDKVHDTTTYMMADEYRKRIIKKIRNNEDGHSDV